MSPSFELLEAFRVAPVFSGLPEAVWAALARKTKIVELRAQDVLWRQGQKATSIGVVLMGRVAVGGRQGRKGMLDGGGSNGLLGEVAFSLDAAVRFDVRCLRRARVALVPAAQLRAQLKKEPDVAVALACELAREVLRLTRRLESLSAGSVEQRLARVLVSLTERFGTPFPGGILMPARLRREDLAALAATTVESASRQISRWKTQGVLVPQPFGFLVKDLSRLTDLGDVSAEP